MKLRKVTNANIGNTTRADVVENTMKNVTSNMAGQYAQFVDNSQPMKVTYYNINQVLSLSGKGFNDTAGPYEGGIKYNVIHDYIVYGYTEERGVDVESGEVLDHHYKIQDLTLLHLPGTVTPYLGDRLSFAVENHRFLYRVKASTPVVFNNKSFIRTEITKCEIKPSDYYEEDFRKDNLIADSLEFVQGHVGTNYKPFMKATDLGNLNKLTALKNEIMTQYNDYFYDEEKNIYTSLDADNPGYNTYVPLLVDLQTEFKPLWTFGINTILTHETIVNKRSKFNYNRNIVRKFLNRIPGAWDKLKEEGVEFTPYDYRNDLSFPTYKIQSYLNDNTPFMVYDYYHGDLDFYDDDGTLAIIFSNKKYLKIPEKYWELFDKYTNDTITIEWLIEWLETYDFEMILCSMIMAFLTLTIIDKVIEKYKELDKNTGILT